MVAVAPRTATVMGGVAGGAATVVGVVAAGLAAVVVEAGGVMVLEPEECARLADAAGLVLWVRERKP